VVLGGAIFRQKEGQWRLKALNRSIAAAGSWGRAPSNMSLFKIGPDLHAVTVRDGYMAQGEYRENFLIMGPVGDRVAQLFFFFDAASDNEGCRERADQDRITTKNAMPTNRPQPSVKVPTQIILTFKSLEKEQTTTTMTI
jgi:hypothetical protein